MAFSRQPAAMACPSLQIRDKAVWLHCGAPCDARGAGAGSRWRVTHLVGQQTVPASSPHLGCWQTGHVLGTHIPTMLPSHRLFWEKTFHCYTWGGICRRPSRVASMLVEQEAGQEGSRACCVALKQLLGEKQSTTEGREVTYISFSPLGVCCASRCAASKAGIARHSACAQCCGHHRAQSPIQDCHTDH